MKDAPHNPQIAGTEASQSASKMLPLVYEELRRLAAHRLAQERPGQTLQATALVHEAWLRLVREEDRKWHDPQHFFCAAATAMRHILIDNARRKKSPKHGGDLRRTELVDVAPAELLPSDDLLALDEALEYGAPEYPLENNKSGRDALEKAQDLKSARRNSQQ